MSKALARERAKLITKDVRPGQDALYLHADGSVAAVGKVPPMVGLVVRLSFVRPRSLQTCCCTKKLRPKHDPAIGTRICHCEFRHARTENGVVVYRQVR